MIRIPRSDVFDAAGKQNHFRPTDIISHNSSKIPTFLRFFVVIQLILTLRAINTYAIIVRAGGQPAVRGGPAQQDTVNHVRAERQQH